MAKLKFLVSLFFVILGIETAYAVGKNPELTFKESKIKMGDINEEDGRKTVYFDYKNEGTTPVVITTVSASCGCTSVDYKRAPIMPGESGKLDVSYDPTSRPGFFNKYITVYTNNGKSNNLLTITGTVIGRKLTPAEMYPFNLGSGIICEISKIDFEYLPLGRKYTRSIDIYNNSDKDIAISVNEPGDDKEFSYYLSKKSLKKGEKCSLIVTFNLEKSSDYAFFKEIIAIFANGKRLTNGITVEAVSVPTDRAKYSGGKIPVLDMPVIYHNFGDIKKGEKAAYGFNIYNDGRVPLVIEKILVSNKNSVMATMKNHTIEPLANSVIDVLVTADGNSKRINERLILITNDPAYPYTEVRVVANLKEE